MDLFFLINQIRYMKPIFEVWDMKWFLLIISSLSVAVEKIFNLFQSDLDLFIILTMVVILDFIFGIIASRRNSIRISSIGGRQTIVKYIEYIIFLGVLVLLSNGIEKYHNEESAWGLRNIAYIMKDIDIFGFFMLIWLEIISITENMVDKKGFVKDIIKTIKEKIFTNENIS